MTHEKLWSWRSPSFISQMHSFRSVIIVKHPIDAVWCAVRDKISDIAPMVTDIKAVTVLERHNNGDDEVRFVNEWRLSPNLPKFASSIIDPKDLGWLDYAHWNNSRHVCNWRIEPFFHPKSIKCTGLTTYGSAIGGRGTRVTFEGNVEIDVAAIAGISKTLSTPVSGVIENIVTTMIPRNFRKVYEAAESWLTSQPRN